MLLVFLSFLFIFKNVFLSSMVLRGSAKRQGGVNSQGPACILG